MSARWQYLALPLLVVSGCDCGAPPPIDGGPEVEVVINEFMADNETVLDDGNGEFDDWIELFNPGESAADLEGFGLSDEGGAPKYVFPAGTTVASRGFLLVFADGDPEQGELHADFKLNNEGESIVFTAPDGTVLDEHTFPAQPDDQSTGRSPDGSGDFVFLASATPGGPNVGPGTVDAGPVPVDDAGVTPPAANVRINEVLALPATPTEDEAGALLDDGWIELFNDSTGGVSLRGHLLDVAGTRLPVNVALEELRAQQRLVLFATGGTAGIDHLATTLPTEGTLSLIAPDGTVLDSLSYGPAALGVSEGILDDGQALLTPTPGGANEGLPVDGGPQNFDAGAPADAGDAG